jgi:hypothetical protein
MSYKCRMIRLTDEQWERIRKHFPEEHIPDGRPGQKHISTRRVLEAVLWILNTGAQWHMLPQTFPNHKTAHRRFQAWCRDETLRRVLTDIANELRDRGGLDEEECFIDATFVMGKGGGAEIGTTKRGKGMKIMAIVDRHGLPLSVSTHAANHHEVRAGVIGTGLCVIFLWPRPLKLDGIIRRGAARSTCRSPHENRATCDPRASHRQRFNQQPKREIMGCMLSAPRRVRLVMVLLDRTSYPGHL